VLSRQDADLPATSPVLDAFDPAVKLVSVLLSCPTNTRFLIALSMQVSRILDESDFVKTLEVNFR